jgi:arylsulfatase
MAARWGSLPVPNRQHLGLITYDAKDPDTNFPPIEPLLPPEGAPNVLIVLLDDVGYDAGNPFGGPRRCRPRNGCNRFHTIAFAPRPGRCK